MNEVVEGADPLLGTSTLRGLLLLGGVAAVAYLAYEFWRKQRKADAALPVRPRFVRVPVELPIPSGRKK